MSKRLYLLIFVLSLSCRAKGGVSTPQIDIPAGQSLAEAERLIQVQDYSKAVSTLRELVDSEAGPAKAHYLLGLALAGCEEWEEARNALQSAVDIDPGFAPAYLELAGAQYRLQDRRAAIGSLRKALEIDPGNEYGNRFLGTLLLLENELEESLEYWNRIGQPKVGSIQIAGTREPSPRVLQNLVLANEAEMLTEHTLQRMDWTRERFRLGSPIRYHLKPRADESWDLEIALAPRLGIQTMQAFLVANGASALLDRRVTLEFPTSLQSGWALEGEFRWDPHRERVRASVQFPFLTTPFDQLKIGFDFRDEDWSYSSFGIVSTFQGTKMFFEYEWLPADRQSLVLHGAYQHQQYRLPNETSRFHEDLHLITFGTQWAQRFGLGAGDRYRLDWVSGVDGIQRLNHTGGLVPQVRSRLSFDWIMERKSNLHLGASLSGGMSGGSLPLDQHFQLGLGADTDLLLRAHPETKNGLKGNNPSGRHFVLSNLEIGRRLLRWRFVDVSGTFFSDTALVMRQPFSSDASDWFQDVGVGFRIALFGKAVADIVYGFDTRESRSTFWLGLPIDLP